MSIPDAFHELELQEWLEFNETHRDQRVALKVRAAKAVAKAKASAKAMSNAMATGRAKAQAKAAHPPPVVQALPLLPMNDSESDSSGVVWDPAVPSSHIRH